MGFKPQNFNLGDQWHFSDGEKVHTFYMQNVHSECLTIEDSGSLGHAVSEDLIHWTEVDPALKRGEKGSYDELDLWTGCTVEHEGEYYLFYTSRCFPNGLGSTISVATSKDGYHWEKYAGNPIISPDPRYYHCEENKTKLPVHVNFSGSVVDCRDLCAVWDEKNGWWWGFYAARKPAEECNQTACIALAKSYDLLHWEQLPPCFCPDKYDCIETPEVFQMGDKWYILCLTANGYGQRNRTGDPNLFGSITIYGVADRPEGPYTECFDKNVLIGSMHKSGICTKTVLHKGKRYLFYTQALWENGRMVNHYRSLPKEVTADATGRLVPKWYSGIEALYEKVIPLSEQNVHPGKLWSSLCHWNFEGNSVSVSPKTDIAMKIFDVQAKNYVLETTIECENASSAGLVFDVVGEDIYEENGGKNRIALLDFLENEVWLTKARDYPKIDARKLPLEGNGFRLKVLAIGNTIEIYVNDVFWVHYLEKRTGGKVGLFAERGMVKFSNTVLHIINEEEQ